MLVCNHFLAGKSIKQARDRRLCPWYQRVVKQASFHALLANSITHTSSRIYWSLYSFYRAPSTCPDHPRSRLFRLCSRCTERERRCRTTEDVGSRNATPDGELEYIIFLGAWKLCIQTYSLYAARSDTQGDDCDQGGAQTQHTRSLYQNKLRFERVAQISIK